MVVVLGSLKVSQIIRVILQKLKKFKQMSINNKQHHWISNQVINQQRSWMIVALEISIKKNQLKIQNLILTPQI